ncbi:MAG: LuxR C-terminal-related transcriptional regulator [Actinomycetes bacterium]
MVPSTRAPGPPEATHVTHDSKFAVPPARESWVRRDALVRWLDDAAARLVLVAAPPGYGKTTLVAQWASGARPAASGVPRQVAWLALDRADDDPAVLRHHLVGTIRRACPGLALELPPAPPDPGGSLDGGAEDRSGEWLPGLLRELADLPASVVLVLDDYQAIRDPRCHDLVRQLVRHATAGLRVVVVTRADPPLGLGRLRAAGEMAEFRAAELRFTPAEAAELVQTVAGVRLSDTSVVELLARTEGWPAGVYLAALCLRDSEDPEGFVRDFAGDHRFVVEYLADEVLRHQPAVTRQFLVRTSVLDRLTAPLCEAVAGTPDSATVLDDLRRSNLFLVPLDEHGRWFRYHHLFAQALQSELARTEPALVPVLHGRAAAWYRAEGDLETALTHALAAGDTGTAVELVSRGWLASVSRGRIGTVRGWLDALGENTVRGNAAAAVCAAWVAAFSGQRALVAGWLEAAQRAGHDGPMPDGTTSLESALTLVRSTFALGGLAAMRREGARAVELENDPTSPWYVVARFDLGSALLASGEARAALVPLEQAAASTRAGPLVHASVLAMLSLAAGTLAETTRAAELAGDASRVVAEHGLGDVPQAAIVDIATAATAMHAGRLDEARAGLEHALRVRRSMVGLSPLPTAEALCRLAGVLAAQGDAVGARAAVDEGRRALSAEHGDAAHLLARLDAVADAAAPVASGADPGVVDPLTDREEAVLRLLAGSLTLREIGAELFLSSNTVKTHTRAIYRKLRVRSRQQAVARARELGLVPVPVPKISPG